MKYLNYRNKFLFCIYSISRLQYLHSYNNKQYMTKIVIGYFLLQLLICSAITKNIVELALITNSICITFWIISLLAVSFYLFIHLKDPGYINHQQQPINMINAQNSEILKQLPKKEIIEKEQDKANTIYNEQNIENGNQELRPEDFTSNNSIVHNQKQQIVGQKNQTLPTVQQKSISASINQQINIQKKYCRLCNLDQPFRTKHCFECQKCVMTFDHHCPWIQNCVGEKNRPLFYVYLIFQLTQITYIQVLIAIKYNLQSINYILIGIFALLLIILGLVTSLFMFHTYLMIKNMTTWEYLSWQKISYLSGKSKNQHPFNYGIIENIKVYWISGIKKHTYQWKMN